MPLGSFRLNSLSKYNEPTGSREAKIITATSNTQVSTAYSKFGTGSALNQSTNGSLTVTNSTDFAFGTDNFTIEMWFLQTTIRTSTYYLLDTRGGALTPVIYITGGSGWRYYTNGAIRISFTLSMSINTWYHVAVCRSGTSTRFFVDGTQRGSTYTDTNNYISDANWRFLGRGANEGAFGYGDEIRVSRSARYTANFTPPGGSFTNDANTVLLCHCDGTNGSTTFVDDNA